MHEEETQYAASDVGPGTVGPEAGTDRERKDTPLRGRILRRFEAWLDEVLADEAPPHGLDAEILSQLEADAPPGGDGPAGPDRDLFSLWSAVIALTQETKLQGREFKRLREGLSPVGQLPDSVRDVLSANEQALGAARDATRQIGRMHERQLREAAETARRQAESSLLDVLLDVRDRLVRGAGSARLLLASGRAGKGGWLGRLFGKAPAPGPADRAAEALLEGYSLSLAHLEDALAAMGISEICCASREFDPRRMTAVDVERNADAPDGTVVEVYRAGYEWHGRVYRPAEVKVARRPAGGQPEGRQDQSDGRT